MVLDWNKRYLAAGAFVLLLLAFAGGMKYAQQRNQESMAEQMAMQGKEAENSALAEEENIQVYVVGAVSKPGVYHLPAAARVYEAINMAQALPTANLSNINLAQKLDDGQAVVVPTQGEPNLALDGPTNPIGIGTGSGKVNINQASPQELDEKLPGIGPAIAQRIVDYRESHGRFATADDLQEVSGIGEKKYAEIKELITVR